MNCIFCFFSEDGSKEERDLIEHHTRLVVEKDQLSRRQDYLNVQLELNETECKISQLRSMLAINGDVDEQQNEEEGLYFTKYTKKSNKTLF